MSTLSGPTGPPPNDAKTGPKGEPMAPIPSASLVVLCPVSGNDHESIKYATLMLQRSARDGSSFRSAVVFPGGALDLADEDAVQKMVQGDLSPCTSRDADESQEQNEEVYSHSLRLCALRETFEETGLLLVPARDSKGQKSRAIGPFEAGIEPKEWKRLREEIHNDARAFPPFLSKVSNTVYPSSSAENVDDQDSILPQLAPMSHHSNWVTPRAVVRPAKRFDAHFFLTVLEKADALGPLTSAANSSSSASSSPSSSSLSSSSSSSQDLLNLSADGTETTSLRLATSEEFIELGIRDQIVLFPPQFYILADLAARLRNVQLKDDNSFAPLIFRHPFEPPTEIAKGVTPVEEEPRGLHPDSYYQFEKRSLHSVTSVEPSARPDKGSSVGKADLQWRGSGEQQDTKIIGPNSSGQEQGEDEPFVFPLVLPGDFLASKDQRAKMSGKRLLDNTELQDKPLNRVYVTPRSREDGGGLIVRGARRRGLPGLVDFEEGARLDELGASGEVEDDDNTKANQNRRTPPFKL